MPKELGAIKNFSKFQKDETTRLKYRTFREGTQDDEGFEDIGEFGIDNDGGKVWIGMGFKPNQQPGAEVKLIMHDTAAASDGYVTEYTQEKF